MLHSKLGRQLWSSVGTCGFLAVLQLYGPVCKIWLDLSFLYRDKFKRTLRLYFAFMMDRQRFFKIHFVGHPSRLFQAFHAFTTFAVTPHQARCHVLNENAGLLVFHTVDVPSESVAGEI